MSVFLIIIASLFLYLVLGQIAVKVMAPRIAANNTKTEHQVEWIGTDKCTSGETYWLTPSNKPDNAILFSKTGNARGGKHGPYLYQHGFRHDIKMMRWYWFVMVPNMLMRTDMESMIKKYDPSEVKRQKDEHEAKMAELKAALKEIEDAEDRLRELEVSDFDRRFEEATTPTKRRLTRKNR